jgi:hypothetical protein
MHRRIVWVDDKSMLMFVLSEGAVSVIWFEPDASRPSRGEFGRPGWTIEDKVARMPLLPSSVREHFPPYGTICWIVIPLWIPLVLLAGIIAYLWWRDRHRYRPGHCRTCGYDLTGNVSGVCPECGTPFNPKSV